MIKAVGLFLLALLKLLGWMLLLLLVLFLAVFLLVLFVPVRYDVLAVNERSMEPAQTNPAANLRLRVKVTWLLHLIHVSVSYGKEGLQTNIRAAGIDIPKLLARFRRRSQKEPDAGEQNGEPVREQDQPEHTGQSKVLDANKDGQNGEQDQETVKPKRIEEHKPDSSPNQADSQEAGNSPVQADSQEAGNSLVQADSYRQTSMPESMDGHNPTNDLEPGGRHNPMNDSEPTVSHNPINDPVQTDTHASLDKDKKKQSKKQKKQHKRTKKKRKKQHIKTKKADKKRKSASPQQQEKTGQASASGQTAKQASDKKQGVFQKIKGMYQRVRREVTDQANRHAVSSLFAELLKLLRSYKPRKLRAELSFSLADPALTGKVTGILSLMPWVYRYSCSIIPDFTSEKLYVEGEVQARGKVTVCVFLLSLLRLVRDKEFMKVVRRLLKRSRA